MTWDERVDAVAAHARGVTDRQAAFLVTVMLHAGVCMDRQYCTFAHVAHGQKTTDFFRRLVDRGYATAHSCRNNSARLFHIQYKLVPSNDSWSSTPSWPIGVARGSRQSRTSSRISRSPIESRARICRR
jgi:hypothetical protein